MGTTMKTYYYHIVTNNGAGDTYITQAQSAKAAKERCGVDAPESKSRAIRISRKRAIAYRAGYGVHIRL
jgi:hypothetical protein